MFLLFAIVVVILVVAGATKLLQIDRRERGEDDDPWNWRGWRGPDDWPKLPPLPKGSGPSDYIPDEWVFEQLGPPPKLIRSKLSPPDVDEPGVDEPDPAP